MNNLNPIALLLILLLPLLPLPYLDHATPSIVVLLLGGGFDDGGGCDGDGDGDGSVFDLTRLGYLKTKTYFS